MLRGQVIQTTGNKCIVKNEDEKYDCTLKGRFRLKGIRSTNPVSVGDFVEFELIKDNKGVINNILPRKNCILRKSSNLSKETHVIASNIDQAVVIFTLCNPETTTVFLDRVLVSLESYSISAVILFNKIDIYNKSQKQELTEINNIYKKIAYKTLEISVTEKINLDKVKAILKNKVSVIVGHSGVGKSSLINVIEPGINLKTGKISDYHKSGQHTTPYAKMLELSFGGYITDTPGIKGFGLVDIKKEEVSHFFPEFFKMSKNCRYYNCTHLHEPDCAVIDSVRNGDISISRYKSYLNIVLDENDKHRQKF